MHAPAIISAHQTPLQTGGRQRGFILIASLMMLVIMTMLAVAMSHNFGLQEKMAGNIKEKGRAFQVAQSTLTYGEYLLRSQSTTLAQSATCSAALSVPTICGSVVNVQQPSSNNSVLQLANGATYTMPNLSVSTSGGSDSYYAQPQFYLRYLGVSSSNGGQVYQVTALGYGGNARAAAVVQSTYVLTSGVKNLGGL